MLYLLDKEVKTVKWNGIPLHEASSAIVKEETNGDFTLTVRYPITDTGIYQLIKEDMLIKAPTPVLGPQLFRIKKPVENDDSLDITAYHITDDVMQRSIRPVSVVGQGCAMALSQMVQNAKTDLGTFSFTSDIMDSRTFNTTDAETLYSVLLDGKHSIVGTWEGELVRDNFALTIKRSRGADRGVVITTHKNLKSYQRTKNSQSVVTRIHAKSTFKAEGAEEETTITVTVDSPLIGNYPYINEKDYENNNAKTVDELRKWAEAKFKNEGIDKISDAIEIEAYELDGQVIHLGDTVNIKSRKHDVDIYKKAIAYEFNALTEEYISITFDDKPGVGGSGVSSGVSNAADVILNANRNTQEVAIERAIRNANQAFDAEFEKRVEEINDGIEQAKAGAELYADSIKQSIDTEIDAVNSSMQAQSDEHDRQVADILSKTQSIESLANQAKSDAASAIARANQVKTEAIADARAQVATVNQALNTAKSELQTAIANADQKARDSQASATALRNDLNSQANKILAQAQAQTALTSRVTTVETLADGTKTTVTELSKTVNKATGDIASVSSQTKTVEDTLSQTRTQYEALTQTVNAQTGQIDSINRKTADLQSGIDGVTARFESLKIGSRNYFKNSKSRKYYLTNLATQDVRTYIDEEFWQNDTRFVKDYVRMSFDIAFNPALTSDFTTNVHFGASPWYSGGSITFKGGTTALQHFDLKFNLSGATSVYKTDNIFIRLTNAIPLNTAVSLENFNLYLSAVIEDYSQSNADFESKIAEYKQTADQNYAGLQSTVSTLDGKVTQNKNEANQTATQLSNRLTTLETYKDGESTRAQSYFEASKTETAKQITAERTAIATNYVAKSVYDEDVRGTTLKLNEIKTTADTAKQNLATYKETVDRKLTELTSSTQTLDGKINTASAKVDTVAGQIRTEISEVEGKIPTSVGGRNLIKNGGFPTNTQHWSGQMIVSQHNYYYNGQKKLFLLQTAGTAEITASTNRFEVKRNTNYTLSFYAFAGNNVRHSDVFFLGRKSNEPDNFTSASRIVGDRRFSVAKSEYVTVTFNSGNNDSGYIRFDNNGSTDGVNAVLFFGEIMLVEGHVARTYESSPEEVMEEVKSVKTTITQTSQGVEQLSTSLSTTNDKVSTAETKIQQLISDVSSKVSQTDYNTLTGRVDSAETAITQNASEISKRLTKTEIDKAITDKGYQTASQVNTAITGKGYQTKSDVDNNITGRGYITNSALQPYALSTAVQNLVQETADSFSRTISETKALIPSGESNLVKFGRPGETSEYAYVEITTHPFFYNNGVKLYLIKNTSATSEKTVGLNRFSVERNTDYTLYFKGFNNSALVDMDVWFLKRVRGSAANFDNAQLLVANRKLSTGKCDEVVVTFNTGNFDEGYIRFDNNKSVTEGTSADLYFGDVSVKKGKSNNGWSPSVEELATVTALHDVKDTVSSHTRTIGAVGETGSILDNVSKVTQTAAGLVAEVSGTNGLKTQVSQLAGSYAIKSLTKAGDVLGQINLNPDGSVRINEGLISVGTKTYIQDGVISSAKIAGLDAGKITTGTLDAARIKANSIDGSKLVFDQAFFNSFMANEAYLKQLFAKNAFITSVQSTTMSADMIKGGLLISSNGATNFDLNNGNLLFNNNYGYIRRTANDKIFEITTLLTKKSDYSPEGLSSKFMIRKSDSSRQSGVSFDLYTTVNGKPTATTQIYSDSFTITSSDYTTLFSLGSKNSYLGTLNLQNWGDIPVAVMSGGLVVKDIGIGGHTESLLKVVERLCSKTGLMWI
ncbi:TPA: phage tail spike protein [Streptococcus suis]